MKYDQGIDLEGDQLTLQQYSVLAILANLLVICCMYRSSKQRLLRSQTLEVIVNDPTTFTCL